MKKNGKCFPSKLQHEVWEGTVSVSTSYRVITVYGHFKIYIEVCGSRVDHVSFLICTDGVHIPVYDPISPEDRL